MLLPQLICALVVFLGVCQGFVGTLLRCFFVSETIAQFLPCCDLFVKHLLALVVGIVELGLAHILLEVDRELAWVVRLAFFLRYSCALVVFGNIT